MCKRRKTLASLPASPSLCGKLWRSGEDLPIVIVSLISLASIVLQFLFPHVALAAAADKSKFLEFSEAIANPAKQNNPPPVAPNDSETVSERKVIYKKRVIITAYSSTPDQTDSTPFITASNTRVRDGIVAANFLPFGTQIKIPAIYGDKIFTVEDRMKSNKKVDIWFPTRREALIFGAKIAEIEILGTL